MIAVLLVMVAPAHAQSFTISTPSVSPGGVVRFSGDGCAFPPPPPIYGPTFQIFPSINGPQFNVNVNASTGHFDGTLTVPSGTVPRTYTLTARCNRPGGSFTYPPQMFTVIASPQATTTSTTSPPTTMPSAPTFRPQAEGAQ